MSCITRCNTNRRPSDEHQKNNYSVHRTPRSRHRQQRLRTPYTTEQTPTSTPTPYTVHHGADTDTVRRRTLYTEQTPTLYAAVHRQTTDRTTPYTAVHRPTANDAVHCRTSPTAVTLRTVWPLLSLLGFVAWSPVGEQRPMTARASASQSLMPLFSPSATGSDGGHGRFHAHLPVYPWVSLAVAPCVTSGCPSVGHLWLSVRGDTPWVPLAVHPWGNGWSLAGLVLFGQNEQKYVKGLIIRQANGRTAGRDGGVDQRQSGHIWVSGCPWWSSTPAVPVRCRTPAVHGPSDPRWCTLRSTVPLLHDGLRVGTAGQGAVVRTVQLGQTV